MNSPKPWWAPGHFSADCDGPSGLDWSSMLKDRSRRWGEYWYKIYSSCSTNNKQQTKKETEAEHFKEHIWPDVVGSRRPPILCKCEQSRVTLPPGTTQELPHALYNTIQCTMHHTMHHATAAYGANFPLLGGIHHTPYLEGSGGERSLEEITSCRERIHMSERMMEGGEKWIEHFLGWWWNWCAATISYLDFQVLNYVVLSYHLILVA